MAPTGPQSGRREKQQQPTAEPQNGQLERQLRTRMLGAILATLGLGAAAAAAVLFLANWVYLAAGWALCEIVFVFVYRAKLAELSQRPEVEVPEGYDGMENIRQYLMQNKFFPITDNFVSPWFLGAKAEDIHEENVGDMMAYGFYYKKWEDLCKEYKEEEVRAMLRELCTRADTLFKPGKNPNLKMMDHLWAPLPHVFRPLAFYAITECVAVLTFIALTALGFERHQLNGAVFYTKNLDKVGQQTPLLFMHGVGGGHTPYLLFVTKLAALDRPVVLPVFKNVSMRWVSRLPTIDQHVAATSAFLAGCGVTRVDLMGHSYGSLVASRFLQKNQGLVATTTLLDPVCFAMYMPTLLNTFLYSFPRSGSFIMDCAMWMVSRELHTTATFCRNFYWCQLNMWGDRVPERLMVVLSGADVLVAAGEVKNWLEEETSARVLYHPSMRHAGYCKDSGYQDYILHHWLQFASSAPKIPRRSSTAAAGAAVPPATKAAAHTAAPVPATAEPATAAAVPAAAAAPRPDPFNSSKASYLAAAHGISAGAAAAGTTGSNGGVRSDAALWADQARAIAAAIEQQRSLVAQQQQLAMLEQHRSIAAAQQLISLASVAMNAGGQLQGGMLVDSDLSLTDSDLSGNHADDDQQEQLMTMMSLGQQQQLQQLLRVPSATGLRQRHLAQQQQQLRMQQSLLAKGAAAAAAAAAGPAAHLWGQMSAGLGPKGQQLDVASSIDLGALAHLGALRAPVTLQQQGYGAAWAEDLLVQ